MTEANGTRTPRRRHTNGAPKDGNQQQPQDQQQGRQSGRGTKSIKYVKLEKERPSLTRDVQSGESRRKSSRSATRLPERSSPMPAERSSRWAAWTPSART